jgi:alpha-beta hydrolase superfamily lysophospholipase
MVGCSSLSNNIIYQNNIDYQEYINKKYEYTIKMVKNLYTIHYKTDVQHVKGTVVHFHGNNENIFTIDDAIYKFLDEGYNLVLFDYRGYGKSIGTPTPEGLNKDAVTILNHVIQNYSKKGKKLIIYAQSLGGAVALRSLKDIKQKDKISSIIVEGSFLSYEQMAQEKFFGLASTLIDDKFAPNQVDRNIEIPIVIIHSKDDNVVPFSQGKALSDYFQNSTFWDTQGEHIEFLLLSSNRQKLFEYLEKM